MIDIGGGVAFCFLRGVWGCAVFSHLHFGIAGSAVVAWEIFLGGYQCGCRGHAEFVLVSNLLMP